MAKKTGTTDELRNAMEEQLTFDTDALENMSAEDIVEIERLYKLSAPIRIPHDKLDSNYDYRWLNMNPKNYRRRRGVGWKPVTQEMLEKLSSVPVDELHMGTHFDPGDHTLRIGTDLVFACIPKRVAVAMKTARTRANQAALSAGKRRFHEAGELIGVDTYDKYPG